MGLVYTRMQTRESVSKAASAFMIDLSQVSLALRGATPRSLIILDEFGKGECGHKMNRFSQVLTQCQAPRQPTEQGCSQVSSKICLMALVLELSCSRTFSKLPYPCVTERCLPCHHSELFTEQFVDDSLPILFCHMKTEIFEGSKNPTFFFRCANLHPFPSRLLTN